MKPKIYLAIGHEPVHKVISQMQKYEICGSTFSQKKLKDKIVASQAEIVMIGEWLSKDGIKSDIIQDILAIKQNVPNVRIIFLTQSLSQDKKIKIAQINRLNPLVVSGIYDIAMPERLNSGYLMNLIDYPKNIDDISVLVEDNKLAIEVAKDVLEIEEEEVARDIETEGYKNVITVSSIKPGCGKSFTSTNLATMIAKFGVLPNGERPRVCIIDADLQNLSLGTLLQIDDSKKNIKSVADELSNYINDKGELTLENGEKDLERISAFIEKSLVQYKKIQNLYVLSGSGLTFDDVKDINHFYYSFIIDILSDKFDIVIIDSNSSLAHETTLAIQSLAGTCYYLLNLDFNNVRNNCRYKQELEDMGIACKVKYILNEDIVDPELKRDLIFSRELIEKDFILEAAIPTVEKVIFYNKLYSGETIAMDTGLDSSLARLELAKICSQICKIENYEDIEAEAKYFVEKLKMGKKRGLFGRLKK